MLDILNNSDIDVFFPALHGQFGEDGRLQQIFEDRGLLYVGSGPQASKLAFDKSVAKKAFAGAGIATPGEIPVDSRRVIDALEEKLADFADKYVIKPITQGSSVGVSIIDDPSRAAAVAGETFERFGPCIIEPFIRGRELTVGILDGKALPIIEIRPTEGFYDYDAKYVDDGTQYVFDTVTDASLASDIQAAAVECFNALGCRHFARTDFILDDGGTAYALEVNTIPGFTSHSLLPKAAAKAGMSMSDMCGKIVKLALA
jgi:D-alanine-D-alanine ligase